MKPHCEDRYWKLEKQGELKQSPEWRQMLRGLSWEAIIGNAEMGAVRKMLWIQGKILVEKFSTELPHLPNLQNVSEQES